MRSLFSARLSSVHRIPAFVESTSFSRDLSRKNRIKFALRDVKWALGYVANVFTTGKVWKRTAEYKSPGVILYRVTLYRSPKQSRNKITQNWEIYDHDPRRLKAVGLQPFKYVNHIYFIDSPLYRVYFLERPALEIYPVRTCLFKRICLLCKRQYWVRWEWKPI